MPAEVTPSMTLMTHMRRRTSIALILLAASGHAVHRTSSTALAPGLFVTGRAPRAPIRCVSATAATPSAFAALGVREELCAALDAAGVHKPNELQNFAIPAILGRESLILGAQTGSGKTLTYLVPTMQSIKDDESALAGRAKPKRPRAVVLVPTRELAMQVHSVAKQLSHHAKLSVEVVSGGVPDGAQRKKLERSVDLLVATPGRLLKLIEQGDLYLGDVRHVILDEVDTMFEAGFGADLDAVLKVTTRDLSADKRADVCGAVQHLAVGATHPQSALALYERWLGGARQLMLAGNHMVPPTLEQRFLTCNGPDAKVSAGWMSAG